MQSWDASTNVLYVVCMKLEGIFKSQNKHKIRTRALEEILPQIQDGSGTYVEMITTSCHRTVFEKVDFPSELMQAFYYGNGGRQQQTPCFVPGPLSCFSPLTKVFPTMQYIALQSWELRSPLSPLERQFWPTTARVYIWSSSRRSSQPALRYSQPHRPSQQQSMSCTHWGEGTDRFTSIARSRRNISTSGSAQ